MAAPQITKAFGGVVPGGIITVTQGTPQKVTSNLNLVGTQKSLQCRQISFSVDASPSGEVYVNYGNNAGKGNATALIIQSGTTQCLPVNSRCVESEIDAGAWWLDGSAACVVAISFADASTL